MVSFRCSCFVREGSSARARPQQSFHSARDSTTIDSLGSRNVSSEICGESQENSYRHEDSRRDFRRHDGRIKHESSQNKSILLVASQNASKTKGQYGVRAEGTDSTKASGQIRNHLDVTKFTESETVLNSPVTCCSELPTIDDSEQFTIDESLSNSVQNMHVTENSSPLPTTTRPCPSSELRQKPAWAVDEEDTINLKHQEKVRGFAKFIHLQYFFNFVQNVLQFLYLLKFLSLNRCFESIVKVTG